MHMRIIVAIVTNILKKPYIQDKGNHYRPYMCDLDI